MQLTYIQARKGQTGVEALMEAKVKRVENKRQTGASAAHGNATCAPDVRPGINTVHVSQSHRKRMGHPDSAAQGTRLRKTRTTVGVLALQGDYTQHEHQLGLLGVGSKLVRLPSDLEDIDGLILPGGESTTMSILMNRFGLNEPIRQFGLAKPIYGTCAGMILLSHSIIENQSDVSTLDLIDIDVERNGYGRQVYSEEAALSLSLGGKLISLKAAFIRAPRVGRLGGEVTVLGEYAGSAVLVQQGKVLASSFHSELAEDTRLLSYFLEDFVGQIARE